MIGTRLGPYEITAALGAGGMGEVWRARDSKLNRDVAIKMLPAAFASDPQYMARFEREAQILAALHHPHIATVFGIEQNALVMELVDGPTLAERIAAGPLPIEDALPIARQIAEALEAAHEKGVIHRDLKPANVKLTSDESVKVLDFGLAKVTDATARTASDPEASPTITLAATRAGVILGTAAYMSPEQARGATVDRRADVWAFGCVLYEMLTGKRTFSGETMTDVLAAVVRADPDWSALPRSTPEPVRRLLKRCLEKDRKRRLPDVGVAKLEIDDALAAPQPWREAAAAAPTRRGVLFWLTGAAVLAAAVAAGALWQSSRAPAPSLWSGVMLGGPARSFSPRLSPDGQLLAFLAFIDELPQLGVMKTGGGSWTMLTHDRDSGYIASASWAPDGSRIYFDRYSGHPRGVYSVPPLGGEPRLLLEDAYGPIPLADGSLIVAKLTEQADHRLFRFRPDSGRLDPLSAFIPGRDVMPMVRAFPEGEEIVYFGTYGEKGRTASPHMYALDLNSQSARELAPGVNFEAGSWSPLAVAPDGQSVFALGADEDTRTVISVPRKGGGKPQALFSFPAVSAPQVFDAARDGSLYLDQMPSMAGVVRISAAGGVPEEVARMGSNAGLAFLPNGDFLYGTMTAGKQRLTLLHPGAEPRTLLESQEESMTPAAALGSNSVAFIAGTGDDKRIAIANLRDGRIVRRFSPRASSIGSIAAAPDGTTLYYAAGGFIWAQPVSGGDPRKVTEGTDATLDSSGQHLYVRRSRSGTIELFRMLESGGGAEKISVASAYDLAVPALMPGAVDARGRILVTVLSTHSFYYRPAILDPMAKTLTVVPVTFDGDVSLPSWLPDGRIGAFGNRYISSLWRYHRR